MQSTPHTKLNPHDQSGCDTMPHADSTAVRSEADDLAQRQRQQQQHREEADAADEENELAASPGEGGNAENEEEEEEVEEDEAAEEDDEEDDDADVVPFTSDEEAIEARAVGLRHYNEHRYEDALDVQYSILRHFEKKYGATAAVCGPYFLDYGLSQLRVLQSKSSVEAVLQPLDQEALKTCFINLDVARVCFQKQEQERGEGDIEVQLRLAEVHNAIAQLHVEREDFDDALKEYESELLTYRFIQQEAPEALPRGRLASVLYAIADCYMKEGDFEGAEARFTAALDEIATFPTGTIAPELVVELQELRDDARDMKGGKFKALQESIQAQFAVEEAEQLPTAQEFYGDTEELQQQHPYVSRLPGESEYSALSMPQSVTNPTQWNEHSNSMSLSLFPPQVAGRSPDTSNSQPVHHVVARRKPKQQPQEQLARGGSSSDTGESGMKRIRTESCS
ncbi:hypothetical protein DQ04_11591020 [Trypanosoma grayi]|uniref:hypothetical protein n=1 Tax=Trypanosoma grayi TaxID=71804 RepID=UPI0004F421C3|nr:hypothetical protein DQ04_11591020 [Trypanosoma grayi]KEG06935.1 hypothetical protein DQ04_11591020 [Trypanosoma grayi]